MGCPGVNHVYADIDGSIGWSPRALVPVRPNWNGLLPVPGDGRYEWNGYQDASALPNMVDPQRGWVASANEMNLPGPEEWEPVEVSYEWYAPYRMHRIAEVLEDNHAHDFGQSMRLQNDYLSIPARDVCAFMPDEPFTQPAAELGRQLLKAWDAHMTVDSTAATLFERWFRGPLRNYLFVDALRTLVDADVIDDALARITPPETVIGDLSIDMMLFHKLAAHEARLREVLESTLASAVTELRTELGEDQLNWAWGEVNTSLLSHPLSKILANEEWLTIGPQPKSGNSETVGLAAPSPLTGIEATGASFRIVLDVGNWDQSFAINTPGQDGDPRSSHYADLYELWLKDGYFPLLYSKEAVEANATERLLIQPKTD
ncbi:penicillin acylase family protein [Arthrobacter sp. SD76]|uniref:penicillin acylase family protein n=1 Tax=Arthrobacter sp. SD76 TaxID=3415007 RepID=UPI003C777405